MRKEDNKDETRHSDQGADDGLAVAEPVLEIPVELKANNLPDVRGIAETGTPRCRYLRLFRGWCSISALELRLGVESGQGVVSLHDESRGQKNGPSDGLRIELDSRGEGHLVLGVGCILSGRCEPQVVSLDVGRHILECPASLLMSCSMMKGKWKIQLQLGQQRGG